MKSLSYVEFVFFCTWLVMFGACVATSCDNSVQCYDATCGTLHSDDVVSCDACTDENIGYTYGECDKATNSRTKYYYWKPPAVCRGGVSLPSPVTNISCDLTECGPGKYLDFRTLQCKSCTKGYYNDGLGSVSWDRFDKWPAQFVTYCAKLPDSKCNSWRLLGDSIDSGSNWDNHYIESILTVTVNLVKSGALSFKYKVSAQRGNDGLLFTDNNVMQFATSDTNDAWRDYTHPVDPGYHRFEWSYSKDRAVSSGSDRAFLKEMKLTGLEYSDSCKLCPPGTFSDKGATICQPCPENFTSAGGAEGCSQCSENEYSYSGSHICIPILPCNERDYASYTQCVDGRLETHYDWIYPTSCNTSNGAQLPATTKRRESCGDKYDCFAGQYFDDDYRTCKYCPTGTYSSAGSARCKTCDVGMAASNKILRYYTFSGLLAEMATDCEGDFCFTDGWRFATSFMDSGVGHGPNVESWIDLNVNMETDGLIRYRYALECDDSQDYLALFVDKKEILRHPCLSCAKDETGALREFNLTNGKHVIRWSFFKKSPLQPDGGRSCPQRAIISEIEVEGSDQGGATDCFTCPPNTFVSNKGAASCSPCPAGTESGLNALSCTPCPANYTSEKGSSCYPCGENTHSTPGSDRCDYDCSNVAIPMIEDGEKVTRHWDLSPLATKTFGPIFTGRELQGSNAKEIIYLSLCNKNNTICKGTHNQQAVSTHVCLQEVSSLAKNSSEYSISAYSLGSVVGFEPFPDGGLVVIYSRSTHPRNCTSLLLLRCSFAPPSFSNDSVVTYPKFVALATTMKWCHYNLEWFTPYGCPLCEERDYNYTYTSCSHGKRSKVYYLKEPGTCRPVNAMPEVVQDCTETSLSNTTILSFVVLATTAVALLVISVIVAFLLFRKKQELEVRYTLLKDSTQNIELVESRASNASNESEP